MNDLSFDQAVTAVFDARGYIGVADTYGAHLDKRAYKSLGRDGVTNIVRDDTSFHDLRCTQCGSEFAVINPESTAISTFTDTFSENEDTDYVTARLVCAQYPDIDRSYPLLFNGSLADLINALNELDQRGTATPRWS